MNVRRHIVFSVIQSLKTRLSTTSLVRFAAVHDTWHLVRLTVRAVFLGLRVRCVGGGQNLDQAAHFLQACRASSLLVGANQVVLLACTLPSLPLGSSWACVARLFLIAHQLRTALAKTGKSILFVPCVRRFWMAKKLTYVLCKGYRRLPWATGMRAGLGGPHVEVMQSID
jgi:hypothetical protein